MTSSAVPGPWLRLTALAAAVATLLAAGSGTLGGGGIHRALAAVALPPLCALVAAGWVAYRRVLPGAATALVLFLVTAAVTGPKPLHLGLAALAFAAAATAAVASFRGIPSDGGPWRDYVTLTKPRIMSLLLLTGACGMIGGAHGWPGTSRFVTAMTGLALACGGASALNHLLDADIDRLMGARTENRPVASGRVPPARALEFGLALSAASFVLLASTINLLTALLALAGNLFYVVVYTRLLKRSTPQNIVIGVLPGPYRHSSAGQRAPATSMSRPSACSRSSSSGHRPTSGRSRCCCASSTRPQGCRCCQWHAASARPSARYSATRWCCSLRASFRSPSAHSAPSTLQARSCSAGHSWGSR